MWRAPFATALFALLTLLLAPAPAAAQRPLPAEPDTSVISPAMVDAGRVIFRGKGTCYVCHGIQLEGSPVAPTLKPHAWKDAKNGEFGAIFYVVTHGVAKTLMVAYPGGITRAEAISVASYVWSVGNKKARP